jgi:YhcH/YjgK/YiaL family protein
MILDRLSSAEHYRWLPAPLLAALDFLRDPKTAQLPDGKHAIDGERLFAIVQQYEPKPEDLGRLEAHRRYWDVQYLAAGEERMGWAPTAETEVTEPYSADRDVGFHRGSYQLFRVPQGTFVIFGPHDAHMPGVALESPGGKVVRKIVVKVELP